ncbi:MAG: glycosyltransferase family 2 protein [Bacteroidales bacterium]
MVNKDSIQDQKPLVSLIIPGYNEEAIVVKNLAIICDYVAKLSDEYNWEIIFVNDGSIDNTGPLAEGFALKNSIVKVINHVVNLNLGNALKTGFANAKGEYVITLDLDLSYAPYHISNILKTLVGTRADVVIASPYMKGGKVTAIPFTRLLLSKWVNRFMRLAAQEKFYTFTGMVRGYRTEFVKSLNLKTKNYEINPEILYKAMILRARIIEIPAHLDWTEQNKLGNKRTSGMRILETFLSGLMAGFIFRPYIFFLTFGIVLLVLALYVIGWILINTFRLMPTIIITNPHFFDDRFSAAVGAVFNQHPQSFIVGGITLLAAIQVLSLSFISLQQKRYFEEMFHINTSILKQTKI